MRACTSELPDTTHPAFAGMRLDNDPTIRSLTTALTRQASLLLRTLTFRGVAYGLDRMVNGDRAFQLGFTVDEVPRCE